MCVCGDSNKYCYCCCSVVEPSMMYGTEDLCFDTYVHVLVSVCPG